jgi:hypothetical protein
VLAVDVHLDYAIIDADLFYLWWAIWAQVLKGKIKFG